MGADPLITAAGGEALKHHTHRPYLRFERYLLASLILLHLVLLYSDLRLPIGGSIRVDADQQGRRMLYEAASAGWWAWQKKADIVDLLPRKSRQITVQASSHDLGLLRSLAARTERMDLQSTADSTSLAIEDLQWQQRLVLGQTIEFSVTIASPVTDKLQSGAEGPRLRLRDPWGQVIADQPVSLSSSRLQAELRPPITGRWLYQLEWYQDAHTSQTLLELPVQVVAAASQSLLLLSRGASFELRYLKGLLRRDIQERVHLASPARVLQQRVMGCCR